METSPSIVYDGKNSLHLNFPPASLPSDEDIQRLWHRGFMDTHEDANSFLKNWIEGPEEKLSNFLVQNNPASDSLLAVVSEEKKKKRDEYLRGLKDRLTVRDTSSHQCEDDFCPHKAPVSMLQLWTEARRVPDDKTYHIERFEPFKYPLINFSKALLSMPGLGFVLANIDRRVNMIRLVTEYKFEAFRPLEFQHRAWSMVEAIYFPENIPEFFTVVSNDWPMYTCSPGTRRYNFLGLFNQQPYCMPSIRFPQGDTEIRVCVIGWYVQNDMLFKTIRESESYVSTYETSDRQKIKHIASEGMNLWKVE